MDTSTANFEAFLASVQAWAGPFTPFVYRNCEGRSVEVFWSNDPFMGRYISPELTLYFSERSGQVIGVEIADPPLPFNQERLPMSAKPKRELTDNQVSAAVEQLKAARAPMMAAGPEGHEHGPECDCTDEELAHAVKFVTAIHPEAAKAGFDWSTLLPLILQIIAMFKKKNPAPA